MAVAPTTTSATPASAPAPAAAPAFVVVVFRAGSDGKLGTDDDIKTVDELHIEVGKAYHYKLESRDVLHSFSVPVFRLKQDAIPGRVITGWFEATGTGSYDIQCAEICGIGHGVMAGRIVIESAEQHAAWISERTPISLAAAKP